MNEVFETLSDVFEELRSESEDREYSVQTEEAKAASRELKKKQKAFEAYLSKLSKEDREFLEDYMDTVDHAHYKEEQRAYYQGIVETNREDCSKNSKVLKAHNYGTFEQILTIRKFTGHRHKPPYFLYISKNDKVKQYYTT